jgi:tetratricopeptide (TPR) repeat protein
MLIGIQIQTGDKDGAVATARDWSGRNKGLDGTIQLAQTLMRVNRYPEAAAVIDKAETDTARPDWHLVVMDSQIAMTRGNKARAASVLKTWLVGHSTDLPIRQAYADVLLQTGDSTHALEQYNIILKSKSDDPATLNNVAWLLRDSDPPRAMALASKAAQIHPNSADITDTLGWLMLQKKDYKGALPVLQRAHAIAPANGQISYHLALALNSLGRKQDAKQALQDALAKGGDFADAADARKLLRAL